MVFKMVLNKLQTDRMRHWLNLSSKTGKKLKKKKTNTLKVSGNGVSNIEKIKKQLFKET